VTRFAIRASVACLSLGFAAGAGGQTIYSVRNTNDSGPGSFRQAILDANANPGMDQIRFAIPSGPLTIAPTSALPTITDPVFLDGKNFGNTRVELSGAAAGFGANGLRVTAGNSTITSLVVRGFQASFFGGGGSGIVLETGGGNFLGDTDAVGNTGAGVLVLNSSSNTVGPSVLGGLRNVISGNGTGIRIEGNSSQNTVIGNRIGTDITGTVDMGNSLDGVIVSGGTGNRIGGADIHVFFENVISGNGGNGVTITGTATGTLVRGNKIGTNAAGNVDLGNAFNGVEISGSANNTVGPVPPYQRNLISGNDAHGVAIQNGASGNSVFGNFIGTNAAGTAALGNDFNGVIIVGSPNNTIGGASPEARNLLAGNGTRGVRLRTGASGNVVAGNWIGLSVNGTPLPNLVAGVGLDDAAVNNTIGGTAPGAGNVISGNGGSGVFITDATVSGNAVLGNRIGTTPSGDAPAGNALHGVHISGGAGGNTIGTPAGGNTIAYNAGDGVFVESGTGIPVRANRVFGNGGLGVDLAPDGVTGNDPGDPDTGPNNLQNFPVLTSASSPGSTTIVQGSLSSAPSTLFKVDFFWSSSCDASGQGEGENYLGTADVTTDGGGNASFTATLGSPSPLGSVITATATDPGGNTSELSNCVLVPARFYTLTPCRAADTREPDGPSGGPALSPNADRSFAFWNRCGVPATARAVSVNLTVTQPAAQGHLTLYPAGPPVPTTSTINYGPGQTRANNAIVTLGPAGDVTVRCVQSSGTVHAILDVNGYFE